MLLSPHIQLVGAFNHIHIFIDPNPNAAQSFTERKRLFELPRSNWTDYNAALISQGGGVFLRSAKSIPISPEIKARFGITQDKLEPNALIRVLLMAEVDLLFNGGIGTYVKSTPETHADVGDKNNDALRINGQELRCKVVGEGGNLGFTQLGRVEYALNGGRLNTDAIDNSAGVNCSDYEVNIKILLNALISDGQLTEKQRNELLVKMTPDVAELVLHHNKSQTEALSIAHYKSEMYVDMHTRLIEYLEANAELDRALEFLPNEDTLIQRKKQNQGLTRPELAVLLAYTKILLKSTLVASDIPDDPYISQQLTLAFPKILQEKYPHAMKEHRLHREIIVMQVANNIVDEMGLTFLHRLQDETGADAPDIVRAYSIVREVFEVVQLKDIVRQLDVNIEDNVKIRILQELNRLTRRGTRWFLRNRQYITDIEKSIQRFKLGVRQVVAVLPTVLKGKANKEASAFSKELIQAKIAKELAYRVGFMSAMFSALDIVDAALDMNVKIEPVASLYYTIGSKLDLGWLREQIKQHPVNTHWDALARAAFRDDLDSKQRDLAVGILKSAQVVQETGALVDSWLKKHEWFMTRWKYMMDELKSSQGSDFTRFAVTLRELRELVKMGLG
jgi:glutamate dehydrogenase